MTDVVNSIRLDEKDVTVVFSLLSGVAEMAVEGERNVPEMTASWRCLAAMSEAIRAVLASCEIGISEEEFKRRMAVATMAEDTLHALGERADFTAPAQAG